MMPSTTHAYGAIEMRPGLVDTGEGQQPAEPSGPVSFADLGIPQPPKLQDTLLGKARKFHDIETKERLYVIVSVITLLATLVFTVYKLCTVSTSNPDFVFALVLLVNTLFCFYYVVHGVLQERSTEIFIFSIATFVVLIYLIVNYAAGQKDNVKLGRLIVAAVLAPVLIGMGAWLSLGYYRSGHLIFRMVGASPHLQIKCQLLFLFFDLLKFDLQLGISMVIMIVVSVDISIDTKDIVVLAVGGFVTIVWFFLGYLTMKMENKIGAIFFFVLSLLELAYVIYKLVQVSDNLSEHAGIAGSTIACGIMAIFVRILVIVASCFVCRNFNQGLKEKAFNIQSSAQQGPLSEP